MNTSSLGCRLCLAIAVAAAVVATAPLAAQSSTAVPTPASVLGFEPGADYHLASYGQIADYFARLAQASDRIRIDTIGRTVRGRPLILAYISSAENLRQLEKFRGQPRNTFKLLFNAIHGR